MIWWEVQRWSRDRQRPSLVVEERYVAEKFANNWLTPEPDERKAKIVKLAKLPENAVFRKTKTEGSYLMGTKTGIFIEHRFYEVPVA